MLVALILSWTEQTLKQQRTCTGATLDAVPSGEQQDWLNQLIAVRSSEVASSGEQEKELEGSTMEFGGIMA